MSESGNFSGFTLSCNGPFSELDTNCLSSWFCFVGLSNTIKYFVVNCVGCGLEDVDAVSDESIPLKDHME